jgi:hypothetical protein
LAILTDNPIEILVDGDGIGYRCGFAIESTLYLLLNNQGAFRIFDSARECRTHAASEWSDYETTEWVRKEVEPLENALHLIDNVFSSLSDKYVSSLFRVFLTPNVGNFRDRISTYAKYKGNREFVARPTYYKEIISYLIEKYGAEYAIGQEADDSLGIGLTRNPNSVCVSFDKDLLQVPGRHYNWVDKEEQIIGVPESKRRFWQQVLSGDATDNVPGAAGIGSKKAEALVREIRGDRAAWDVVLKTYSEIYGNEEGYKRALETARLVYVRRKPEEIFTPPA